MTTAGDRVIVQALRVERGGALLLDDLTLTFPAAALSLVIGPNGAGKSTLLRALAGLTPLAAGTVQLGGAAGAQRSEPSQPPELSHPSELSHLSPAARARRLAWVPEHSDTPFAFSVGETVLMGRYPWHGGNPRPADAEAAGAALALVGLSALAARQLPSLSSGERQRVAVARALAGDAPVLLLDEPCANLDIGTSLRLLETLRCLARAGRTIIATMHDLALAHRYADYAACLAGGRVAAAGAPAAVFSPAVLDQVFGVRTRTLSAGGTETLRFEI